MRTVLGEEYLSITPEQGGTGRSRSLDCADLRSRDPVVGNTLGGRRKTGEQEARDEKFSSSHSGETSIDSSGCHSKNPEHSACSRQQLQPATNFCFQSEIEALARWR